jgi:3'-5' exoribonuclease
MIDVKTLQKGQSVEGQFAIRSKDGAGEGLRDYSNKPGRFFVLKVGNSTGDMTLKYWGGRNPDGATGLFTSLEVGDVVTVKGQCTYDSYSKGLVISINEEVNYGSPQESLKKAQTEDYSLEDFMPALTEKKIKDLFSELKGFIEGVENPHLKGLLERFFGDQKFVEVFKKTPAAKKHHHNYIGGLLEHTVNVARLCDTICRSYQMDKALLITGALLHDIGKTREYSLTASIDVTDEGRFIGHLPLTAEMVSKKIEELEDFPETLALKVVHMILSHHGEVEKGSPKEPAFPEAMALFHADYMDAFVKNMLQELDEAGEDEQWKYSRSLRRFIHTG